MKQIISLLFVAIFSGSINIHAQKNYNLTEEYYQITKDSEIDNLVIKEIRSYSFEDSKFISGQKNINGIITKLDAYIDQYNSLLRIDEHKSYVQRDEHGYVTMQRYMKNQNVHVHYYTYNPWGDLIRDELIIRSGNEKNTTVFTYEYFYLSEFTYAKNAKGVSAISGYKDNYKALWLKRTVRKNDFIVEHVNRKVSKRKTKFYSGFAKKILKIIGYGPTVN